MRAGHVLALSAAVGSAALIASGVAVKPAAASCKPTKVDSYTIYPPDPKMIPPAPPVRIDVTYTVFIDDDGVTYLNFSGAVGDQEYWNPSNGSGKYTFTRWFDVPSSYRGHPQETLEFSGACMSGSLRYRARIPRPGQSPVTVTKPVGQASGGCSQDVVLDLHGSGAKAGEDSKVGRQFAAAMHSLHPRHSNQLVPVPFAAAGGAALVGAFLHLPGPYHRSVVRMKDWLRSKLRNLAKKCPASHVFLVGLSQGAQAAGDVFAEQPWPQIKGVALFGDTKYNHLDTVDRFGLNASPKYRRTFRDGSLGTRAVWPASKHSRVLSFCHFGDPVCAVDVIAMIFERFRQHDNYGRFGEPKKAAQRFG